MSIPSNLSIRRSDGDPSDASAVDFRNSSPFDQIEQQVIILAVSSAKECAGTVRPDGFPGPLRRLLNLILPDSRLPPLASPRLEALRKLACEMFAARGQVDEPRVQQALGAGIGRSQIEYLAKLAGRFR